MYKKSYIQLKRDTMYIVRISLHKISNSKIYYNCVYFGLRNNHVYRPRCINLDKNGNLYFCGLIQNIHLLEQYFNIRFNKIEGKYGDFVNIHKINDINDILYGINNKIPFCDYCIDYPESNIVEWK